MKTMSRGQYHGHLARQRMKVLRGEAAKAQGDKQPLPVNLTRVMVGVGTCRGREIEPAACFECGYYVCSCKQARSFNDTHRDLLSELENRDYAWLSNNLNHPPHDGQAVRISPFRSGLVAKLKEAAIARARGDL